MLCLLFTVAKQRTFVVVGLMRVENVPVVAHEPYKVGGSLPWDSPVYVERQADVDLLEGVCAGDFCTVLGPRQMGKSSLRVRTRHRLEARGYRCATIYATQLIDSPQDYYRWDKQVVSVLWDSLYPSHTQPLQQWLAATDALLPHQRLEQWARDLLAKALADQPIVVFIDAAEALLTIPFLANDLFSWIWHCRCLRKIYPVYRNLNFVILGSARTATLIQNDSLSFSQRAIALKSFQLADTAPLQAGFQDRMVAPQTLLEAVLRWTGGQPLLTHTLCYLLKTLMDDCAPPKQPTSPLPEAIHQWVDHVVNAYIIADWSGPAGLPHLWATFDALNQSPLKPQLLAMYQSILAGEPVALDGTDTQAELLQSGLVVSENQQLKSANEIYRHAFAPRIETEMTCR